MKTSLTLKVWIEDNGEMRSAFRQDPMNKAELSMFILELENMVNILKNKYLSGGVALLKDD